MATIVRNLKKQNRKDSINKSQPNIFKMRQCSQTSLKSYGTQNVSNIKIISTPFKVKKQSSESPRFRDKNSRPSSSLLNPKNLIEDYITNTHNSSPSRQPVQACHLQQKSISVMMCQTTDTHSQGPNPNNSIIDKSFTKTYERFAKQQMDSATRLSSLKKEIEDNENSKIRKIPLINQRSKELCKSSEDFLTRMKKNEESVSKKKEIMIKVKKKKEFESLKNNRKAKGNSSMDLDINNRIQNLFEWDCKRKKKIEIMKEIEVTKELNTIAQKPNVSYSTEKRGKTKNNLRKVNTNILINRLYKEDPMRIKEKKLLLMKVFTPSFEPQINTSRNSKFKDNDEKKQEIGLDYLSVDTENLLRERIMYNKNKKYSDL